MLSKWNVYGYVYVLLLYYITYSNPTNILELQRINHGQGECLYAVFIIEFDATQMVEGNLIR